MNWRDVDAALRRALLLPLQGESSGRTMVLTTAPFVWAEELAEGRALLVDVSRVTGDESPVVPDAIRREESVIAALVDVGWPPTWIRRAQTSDAVAVRTTDITVLGPDKLPLLLVDVARSMREGRGAELTPDQRAMVNGVFEDRVWSVVAHPGGYEVVRPGNATSDAWEHPPSPSDLGIARADLPAPARRRGPEPFAPPDIAALKGIVAEHAPHRVVLDHTFRWSDDRPLSTAMTTGAQVERLLEQRMRRMRRQMHVMLLEFFAQRTHVEVVSAVLPSRLADAREHAQLRSNLSRRLPLAAIVEFPPGVTSPEGVAPANLVYLAQQAQRSYFAKVRSPRELLAPTGSAWLDSLEAALAGQVPLLGFTRPTDTVSSWDEAANRPSIAVAMTRLGALGTTRPLGELYTRIRTPPFRLLEEGALPPSDAVRALVHACCRGGTVDAHSARWAVPRRLSSLAGSEVQVADLLLGLRGSSRGDAAVVEQSVHAIPGSALLQLRPKAASAPTALALSRWVRHFLASDTGRQLLEGCRLSGREELSVERVLRLPVLLPPTETRQTMLAAADSVSRLRAFLEETEARQQALLSAESATAMAQQLAHLSRRGTLVLAEAARSDDPQHQIASIYPHPLAFPFSMLSTLAPGAERFDGLLRVGRNLLAYLGALCLALSDRIDLTEALRAWTEKLKRSGLTEGDRRTLLLSCTRAMTDKPGPDLLVALGALDAFREDRGLGKFIHTLVRMRNARHHGRIDTTEAALKAKTPELEQALIAALGGADLVTRFPLGQVTDADAIRGRPGLFRVKTRAIMGSHPALTTDEVETTGVLTRGDLYVGDLRSDPIALHPWVRSSSCALCRREETYFLDRWDTRSRRLSWIGFEQGHELETDDADIRIALGEPR